MSNFEWRHCNTLLSHCWTHRISPRGWTPPLSDISHHRAEEVGLCKWLLLLRNDRSRIWTACWSAVLPEGGLQRPCRNHLLSSFWELAGPGRTSIFMQRPKKTCFSEYGTFNVRLAWQHSHSNQTAYQKGHGQHSKWPIKGEKISATNCPASNRQTSTFQQCCQLSDSFLKKRLATNSCVLGDFWKQLNNEIHMASYAN